MTVLEETTPSPTPSTRALVNRLGLGRAGSRLGLIVVAIGLLIIGIGWNGAAGAGGEVNHVPVVQAQLPWLLSGGFLGLGVVVLGAAIVIANAYRESEARMASKFDALLESLDRLSSAEAAASPAATVEGDLVVAGSASYHRPDCRLAQGRHEAHLIEPLAAVQSGLAPCRICQPPVPA